MAAAVGGANVSMVNCTLASNNMTSEDIGRVISASARGSETDDISRDTEVRLEGCTFTGNTVDSGAVLVAESSLQQQAVFYSDSPDMGVCMLQDDSHFDWDERGDERREERRDERLEPKCDTVMQPVEALEAGSGTAVFLSADSQTFLDIQQVLTKAELG